MSNTKYVNPTSELKTISFTDGTAVFLFRGQSIETDKEVKLMDKGVKVIDKPINKQIESTKPLKKKAETDVADDKKENI